MADNQNNSSQEKTEQPTQRKLDKAKEEGKAVPGKHSKGEWHLHKLNFQMVYILKGWVTFEYEGQGTFTFHEGDSVLQPPKISHREIEHSEDLELLEITSPASFDTETV